MPALRLCVEVVPALPRLAWLAEVPEGGGEVRVRCGAAVEHGESWLVEGVWDGPFEAAGFVASEAFFGSGLRIDGDVVRLCASSAPVDRLLAAELDGRTLVANSLPLLLGATGARLLPDHDYFDEIAASQLGVRTPTHPLRVRHPELGEIVQVYHGNLRLGPGAGRREVELRARRRRFESFDDYLALLRATLAAIGENLASPARTVPLTAFTTCSAGYDSATVACLVREIGVREAYTTRPGDGPDATLEDGAAVAEALGLRPRLLRHPARGTGPLELDFLASTVWGSELAWYELARELAARDGASVVFSGYYGGVLWESKPGAPPPAEEMRRVSDDGLGIAEVRLASGFVHVPVPFLFALAAPDLRRVALSPEMAPWRLGRAYDKPIPRRILETAGLARGSFAREKRAIWEAVYELPWDRELRRRFVAWLDRFIGSAALRLRAFRLLTALDRALVRGLWRLSPRRPLRLPFGIQRWPLGGRSSRQLMFRWANDELADRRAAELAGATGR